MEKKNFSLPLFKRRRKKKYSEYEIVKEIVGAFFEAFVRSTSCDIDALSSKRNELSISRDVRILNLIASIIALAIAVIALIK